ncbi:unnamed protein product [Linum tenue]|uniref:DUF7803 domain-containing protein n=1 Tax=Linum tenue TaxID=586396 RepID=A0AAV0QGG8_9ROSI|nr:unnamed protein product [Linum tenue]
MGWWYYVQWFFCPFSQTSTLHPPSPVPSSQAPAPSDHHPSLRCSAALAVAAQAPLSIFPLPAHLVAFIGGTSAKTSLLVIAFPEGKSELRVPRRTCEVLIYIEIKSSFRQLQWMPTMEETILVGEDLMLGPPSPLIPKEIASHVVEGFELCDGVLKNLFLCLQVNDIEPFCQDELSLYRECAEKRDKLLRQRLQDSEHKLGLSMPLDEAKKRVTQLEAEATAYERRLILASGVEGMEGFRQRWSFHDRMTDTKRRMEALKQGMKCRMPELERDESITTPKKKRWFLR